MITLNALKKAEGTENFFESVTKATGEKLKKYNHRYEYEIKLNTNDKKMTLYTINKKISDLFEKKDCCYINRVERYTDSMWITFWIQEGDMNIQFLCMRERLC